MRRTFTYMLIPKRSVGFLPRIGGMCLFLTSLLVHAQQRAVSGTVKDERGQLLQEAGVIKSNSNGVTTDADGKYLRALLK